MDLFLPTMPHSSRQPSSQPLDGAAPPPCFYFHQCRRYAELEKQGKSLCRPCAALLRGDEYPLRPPSRLPLYPSGRELARQLEMIEPGRKGLNATERSNP